MTPQNTKVVKNILELACVFSAVFVLLSFYRMIEQKSPVVANTVSNMVESVFAEEEPLVFVVAGDVMLGRHVRTLMRENGAAYPFEKIGDLFAGADAVIVNLEGPITQLDLYPTSTMRFSFDPSAAETLARFGVTHVSLANNHAEDQGRVGMEDTQRFLTAAGVGFFGDTLKNPLENVVQFQKGTHALVFIGLDATAHYLNITKIAEEIAQIPEETFVVTFLHWGDEYQPTHNEIQETIAHALIDAGADVVVGAHPHVVQDIEIYNGAPIFYSLGNFIFDQYWNEDVQTGLVLHVTLGERATYELIPVTSIRSQPTAMSATDTPAFLLNLSEKSPLELNDMIRSGTIVSN